MTGMSAPQAWADLAFNPSRVPRTVPSRLQRFMPLQQITEKQKHLLNRKIMDNAFGTESVALLFGDGFVSVEFGTRAEAEAYAERMQPTEEESEAGE